jgi:translation initiation factor IF-3
MIRIPQVRVIDDEGNQLGIMPTPKALEMAQERGLDLVEVAPMASPPVTRFLDFGQYKYDLTKREKEAKRRQRAVTFKEVRLSPKIGVGDFETKVHRAVEFLEEGDRIKVTVRFRGRELTHPELGRNMLGRFSERVKEHGVPERTPVLEGKSMFITMASTHKPKGLDAPAKSVRTATDGAAADEAGDGAEPKSEPATATPAAAAKAPPAATATAKPEAPPATGAAPTATTTATSTADPAPAAAQPAASPEPVPQTSPAPRPAVAKTAAKTAPAPEPATTGE